MNRLRTRLTLSFLGVMVITMTGTALLLILALAASPTPRQPIYNDLLREHRTLIRTLTSDLFERNVINNRDRLQLALLNGVAEWQNVRVIVATPEGRVLHDTANRLAVNEQMAFSFETFTVPEETLTNARPDSAQTPPANSAGQQNAPQPVNTQFVRGSFQEDGEAWLFIGQNAPARFANAYLLTAQALPPSPWGNLDTFFEELLLVPLVQATLAGLVIALALSWLISRSITRPLQRLQQGTQHIAAGDYHERVPVQGPDEIRALAATFNNMAEAVNKTQTAQQDFLANVSHDLRTPLTSIQGFSQAITDGTSADPAKHAQIIHDEAGRLNRLVGELLDLARIASGRLSLNHARLNLGPLAEHLSESAALRASQKGVQLVRDIRPVPDIAGDGDRLAQVITNLLDNALKFTPQGGTVRLALGPHEGGVGIVVSDTGQGIPESDLPRIFERFYQVDKSRPPERGTGLGLAITAEIVHAHGGRIRAHSGGTGKGTTFSIWLPALDMSTIMRRI